eukprot:TRINITY_DN11987_c0_g1_i1.p1 TRINITY_DN11987_c0_g1~~TRINITY_DN11987_c0_g1_i1.p1  ORF type:complete len:1495 (+),score=462.43 TRINITY_DN11987_c0_g1_i1:149-4633(+)
MSGRGRRRLPSAPGTPRRAPASSSAAKSPAAATAPTTPVARANPEQHAATIASVVPRATRRTNPASERMPLNLSNGSEPSSDDSQNVTVSVRVRPQNSREKGLDSPSVITMEGRSTIIAHPTKAKTNKFTFDHSFWSHTAEDRHFADQSVVYSRIGVPLLKRCLEGYNVTAFAYGQTGSGKSYSMMGPPGGSVEDASKGIIPRFCDELFQRARQADAASNGRTVFKVEVSYFEIYSERIYDLLAPPSKAGRMAPLRVREHPVLGPYVDQLTMHAAVTYNDIEGWLAVGSKHRATASTNMNATSSRSHAVFTMVVSQITKDEDDIEHTKVSKVNLVDLAGSERSDVAGTSGQRLREGSAINKSLHTLGKVISLLADKATKKRSVFIPYRDSVLTWILKESLGGNSRTAMLATISPALDNYEETMSTLRYAHQARQIVNDATVNEDPNAKLVRELREEIERLRAQYGDNGRASSYSEVQSLREKLTQTQGLMTAMNRSWEEKLREAEKMRQENAKQMEASGMANVHKIDNRLPNLVNLNEDPQLSEMLFYMLREGETVVGNREECDVQLSGTLVLPKHCVLTSKPAQEGEYAVTITTEEDATVFVNGHELEPGSTVPIEHSDRLIIANNHFFRLNIPSTRRTASNKARGQEKNYQFAKDELEQVQAEILQRELEEERKRHEAERAEYLNRLQDAEKEARDRLDQQKQTYEERLKSMEAEISAKAEANASALSANQSSLDQLRKEEQTKAHLQLEQQRQELEHERRRMQARMEAEREKERRRLEEETAAKNKIIEDLKAERERIQQDVLNLKSDNEKYQQTRSNIRSMVSSGDVSEYNSKVDPHEVLAITSTLKEANKIAKDLGQYTMFTLANVDGEPMVKVTNTQMKVTTMWRCDQYNAKLEKMRDVHFTHNGADVMPEEVAQLFFDPNDEWEEDLSHSLTSSLGSYRNSRMSDSGLDAWDGAGMNGNGDLSARDRLEGRTFNDGVQLRPRKLGDAKALAAAHNAEPSVTLLCCQYIRNTLNSLRASHVSRSSADEVVTCVSALKSSVDVLRDSYFGYMTERQVLRVRDLGVTRNTSLSAAMAIEVLGNIIRSLKHSELNQPALLQRFTETCTGLSSHLIKLMQGVENEIDTMVNAGHEDVLRDISNLSMLAGELAIATSGGDTDGDLPDPFDDESEDFESDEDEAQHSMAARMVELPAQGSRRASQFMEEATRKAATQGIDEDVLLAFQRGAQLHVKRSMESCEKDLSERIQKILALIPRLNNLSHLNEGILRATARVMEETQRMLTDASRCQAHYTESIGRGSAHAKRTFYRKTYQRARGIIGQVELVVDSIAWLTDACTMATEGSEDVEKVQSHSVELRSKVAHLLSAADSLMSRVPRMDMYLGSLHDSAGNVQRASTVLQKECKAFSGTAHARASRSRLLSSSVPSTPHRGFPGGRTISLTGAQGVDTPVQKQKRLLEQRALVLRLENELEAARQGLVDINKFDYESSTTAI